MLQRARGAGRKVYMLSLHMNKVILTPHYTHYLMAAPLTQCLLSEVYYTLACQDHLSKQSTLSPSGAGSDSALGNGNWQQVAGQTQSLSQSWIWAPVLITAPISTLFLLFLVSHCSFVCLELFTTRIVLFYLSVFSPFLSWFSVPRLWWRLHELTCYHCFTTDI